MPLLWVLRDKKIAVWGLTFKPNTDDMREAPSIDIIRWITAQGAMIRVYDPVATETGREALKRESVHLDMITFCENPYEVAQGADAIIVVTEWNEFKSLNMQMIRNAMHRPVLIDGRNIYEALELERQGFIYRGMGRSTSPAPSVLPAGDTTSILTEQPTLGLSEGK